MRRRLLYWVPFALLALFGSMTSLSVFAQAADYPSKPIKIVVTFPPGGNVTTILMGFEG